MTTGGAGSSRPCGANPGSPTEARGSLCLNMIVRNEMANLERCLGAVVPYIDCWVIGDTGSSDGTQAYIRSFFAERGIPGELHSFPFENFEQARNAALDLARDTALPYAYLLLADADMELVVDDPAFARTLTAPGYRLIQKAGSGLTYWNTRLLRRGIDARYHGVTHEYVDVPGGVEPLTGAWYKDHATGSNRRDKFERDIRLLTAALAHEPDNNRYWFYLAQSYRDAGQSQKAVEAYARRADAGGWEEEAWYARLQEARCLLTLGDESGFLRQMLRAFNQRPQRAESLYELARFYRERGLFDASVLFSEPGMRMRRPDGDILFLEDFVYTTGLKEEFSIAANYVRDPGRKDRGFATCDWLASSRLVPARSRDLARSNLLFYVQSAREVMPSFRARRLAFTAPKGLRILSASIASAGNDIALLLRTGNALPGDDGLHHAEGAVFFVRDHLVEIGDDLEERSTAEIASADSVSQSRMRTSDDGLLFSWRGGWWCSSGAAVEAEHGIVRIANGAERLQRTDRRAIRMPDGTRLGAGCIPVIDDLQLYFVAGCDPTRIVDERGAVVCESRSSMMADQCRGATSAIAFDDGWLAVVREVAAGAPALTFVHRFVWFDRKFGLRRAGRPFYFDAKGPERAAGLAWTPNGRDMLISYVDTEGAAWIARIGADDISRFLVRSQQWPFDIEGDGQGNGPGKEGVPVPTTEPAGVTAHHATAPADRAAARPDQDTWSL